MPPAAAHQVAVVAFDGISAFHLAIPSAVFGPQRRSAPALPYRVTVCAERPGQLTTTGGFEVLVEHGLEALETADTVILPSADTDVAPSAALLAAISSAHRRGARVVGLCLGSFLVAASGIADGREVATHWHAADELAARYPAVRVRSDVLWCDDGDLVTSAGVAAALDCCLHVLRADHGENVAAAVARSLVLAPHRDGSQAQFIPTPVVAAPGPDPFEQAMAWAAGHLGEQVDLDRWAARAAMSRRTFTRQFRSRTGTSPTRWLLERRLAHARVLLETTADPVESIAHACGYATAAALRQHFAARYGTSPSRHRDTFRTAA
ncbi:GlxA family transcriptional regulator [Cellulomonas edaphi]|uniref:Helix-turn-helix domain-containing protein n=1 Tax=Cellulomonas edaphi TaxID=3053468 RepID=A0ABT7SAN6_9CELL|nr:helix-turn-helix domain-containing protein [Cellulomons edaphi]MDM7832087.1 helix-turn-helix domain-containing protein [Cellulomons edaphi]